MDGSVKIMNEVNTAKKRAVVCALKKFFPKGIIKEWKSESDNRKWSDIIAVAYRAITDMANNPDYNRVEYAYYINNLIDLAANEVDIWEVCPSFDKQAGYNHALASYSKVFDSVSDYVVHLMDCKFYPDAGDYRIVSGGKEFVWANYIKSVLVSEVKCNNGLPVSVGRITPRAMEVCVVSKDPNVQKIDDQLYGRCTGGGDSLAVIKVVPDLPDAVKIWAMWREIAIYR